MSIQAVSWVLDYSESRLAARLVLTSIANHADKYGKNAWPSVATIAQESRISEREVQRSLPELVNLGELVIEANAGPHGTHFYHLPKMPGVTICHPQGVTSGPIGVTIGRKRGDQLSPEPSFNRPIKQPSKSKPSAEAKNASSGNKPDFQLTAPPEKDTRYKSFLEILFKFYDWTKQKVPMYAADFDQLKKFLGACPTLTEQEFKTWLGNYARSDEVNLATAPRSLLPKLGTYAPGPLNKYGRPKDAEVEPESKDARIARKNRELLDRFAAKEGVIDEGGSTVLEGTNGRDTVFVGQHSRALLSGGS